MENNSTWSFEEKAGELRKSLASFASEKNTTSWNVLFFGKNHVVSVDSIRGSDGAYVTPAVSVVLMSYVMNGEPSGDPSPWIGFRELRGAGPLMGYFQENTGKTLEKTFSGKIRELKKAAMILSGKVMNEPGFDLSLLFEALPGIPVILRFNDADEGFPASCQILFRESTQDILDIKCIGVIGTYLTGVLLEEAGKS